MIHMIKSSLSKSPFKIYSYCTAFVLLFILVLLVTKNPFYTHILILICFYAMLSIAWNLIGGFGGQLSLGHSAFLGVGAYTAGIMYVRLGFSPWIGMLAAFILASILALVIGYPCFRLRGPFFTLATLAIVEVLRVLAIQLRGITFGSRGISIPPTPGWNNFMFVDRTNYLLIIGIALIIVFVISKIIENGKIGLWAIALKEDEDAARSLGIDTLQLKIILLVISAAIFAFGGVFYAQYFIYFEPITVFNINLSIRVALISIIGGISTSFGPILGAIVLIPIDEFLRAWLGGRFPGLPQAIYGLLLVIVVLRMPNGVLPMLNRLITPLREKVDQYLLQKK
jgi:branched-chain amino acid transport system permease protein